MALVPASNRSLLPALTGLLLWCWAGALDAEERSARLAAYDFGAEPAVVWRLPTSLDEISGLAVTRDGRLLAHDDERGVIYELDLAAARIAKRFSLHPPVMADFEGIAVSSDRVFLLVSDGRIVETREGSHGERVRYRTWSPPLVGRCDFEGLVDLPDGRLVLGCKRFKGEKGRPPTLFVVDLANDGVEAIEIASEKKLRLTAIEHDRERDHLIVLSSNKRRIVELTREGEVVASHKLQKESQEQPEGLAIAADGALYIADEDGKGRAHLVVHRPTE